MTQLKIAESQSHLKIELAEDRDIHSLADIFEDMYSHFHSANGITRLPEDGFKNWMGGYSRSRGISRTIYTCLDGSTYVGMIEGVIKIGGATSDLGKLGHIAHLYVSPNYRLAGIGRKLVEVQRSWFTKKRVDNETLEVVHGNELGQKFWEALGFKPTFITMVKPLQLPGR